MRTPFLTRFKIEKNAIVAICGAGGKTTLLYTLANEARSLGYKVLVTTTTRLFMPERGSYDAIDLSGRISFTPQPHHPGIYFCATGKPDDLKVTSLAVDSLRLHREQFDLILIEADGAAQKSLKGWDKSEPVIPGITTRTIGVVDIQTLHQTVSEQRVHRLERFCQLVSCVPGTTMTTEILVAMICRENGLFQHARGQRSVFINKVESPRALSQARKLAELVPIETVIGSLHQGVVYESA